MAHGPISDKDYTRKINKKAKAKALATVLSKKLSDAEVVFVEGLSFNEPKTADAKVIIKALATASDKKELATKRKNAALIVLDSRDASTEKSFRNFGNFEVVMAKDLNPVNLLTYKYVILANPEASLEVLEKRVA